MPDEQWREVVTAVIKPAEDAFEPTMYSPSPVNISAATRHRDAS